VLSPVSENLFWILEVVYSIYCQEWGHCWELLYAVDLDVTAETDDNLIKRLNEWKDNMEKDA